MKKRVLSFLMVICMMFSQVSVMAYAEGSEESIGTETSKTGLCEHHTAHDENCGYVESVEGSECTHEHSETCYQTLHCIHEHNEECEFGENCNHECTVESGCITVYEECQHVHDENCGYVETVSCSDCGYVCGICNAVTESEQTAVEKVQAMIDALPDAESVTEENRATVEAELDAIDEAKSKLSAEERVELDFSKYDAVIAALNALDNMGGAEVPVNVAENVGDFTVEGGTLGKDYTYENDVLTVETATELTIKNTENSATTDRIVLKDGANVILAGVNIDVSSADRNALYVNSGTVTITLADGTENFLKSGVNCAGLCVEKDKEVTIKGNGRLEATGGAGIGSSYLEDSGTITISGGSIIATGNLGGAGIGGNFGGTAEGTITISGGSIIATGNLGGAGIGGGSMGSCVNVKITGGTIKAVAGGEGAKEIGAGEDGISNGTLTDADGNNVYLCTIDNPNGEGVIIDGKVYKPYNHIAVDSTDTNLYAYLTGTDHKVQIGSSTYTYTFDSSKSTFSRGTSSTVTQGTDFVISAKNSGDTLEYVKDYIYQSGVLMINSDKEVTIRMKDGVTTTTDTIAVADGVFAKITLACNVTMGGSMTVNGTALIYTGGYTLTNHNGDTISDSKTITFKTDGAVYAYEVISGSNKSYPINDPSKTGYTFAGWYQGDTEYEFGNTVGSSVTLEAKWTAKGGYVVSFDSNGGTGIATKANLKWSDKVLDGVSDPERTGYEFDCWTFGGQSVTADTKYGDLAPNDTVFVIELEAQWKDVSAPAVEIKISDNSWKNFLNSITFGIFFKDTQTVTITAEDKGSGVDKVYYYISENALSEQEVKALEDDKWKLYDENNKPSISPDENKKCVVYVNAVDKAQNAIYISSDGIVFDTIAPVISGIEDGKTYCSQQTVTVIEENIATVTFNGMDITKNLDENNQFTLSPTDGKQIIVVIDKAGNEAKMTVTVNNGHQGGTEVRNLKDATCTEDGYTGDTYCKDCGEKLSSGSTITKLGHTDKDKDHVCDRGSCKATISTCSGGTATCSEKAVCEYCGESYGELDSSNHTGGTEVKNDKAATCTEAGYTGDTYCKGCGEKLSSGSTITKLGHTDKDKDHVCDRGSCKATISTCSGGTATCTEKAVCEYCGESYGELDSSNHTGGTEVKNDKAATCTEAGYTGDTYCKGCGEKLSSGNSITKLGHTDKDKDHVCDRGSCKVTISTCSGETATCTEKAVCEYCGESYGELDSSNHTGGTEVKNAKAATCTEAGYTGDTYCKGCGEKLADGSITTKLEHIDEDKDNKCDICGKTLAETDDNSTEAVAPPTGDATGDSWRMYLIILIGSVAVVIGIGAFYITQRKKE